MMTGARLLKVRHLTVYRYAEPVLLGEHRMMFRPRESHDLHLVRNGLVILPRPTRLHWLHDVFDNSVAIAAFTGETDRLSFDSTVTLEHTEAALPDYQLDASAATFPFSYSAEDQPELIRALERGDANQEVDRWVARLLPRSGPHLTMDFLRTITRHIQEEFAYSRRTQRGVQSPIVTLECRGGTCRDFAWLMIDAVRALGFAARFVSGYVLLPTTADTTMIGGGATHAWLQGLPAWCGMGRLRSDQQHHRQPQPHSGRRGMASCTRPAVVGHVHWPARNCPRHAGGRLGHRGAGSGRTN
jgi:transglutaminase-like putative cysteine protease